MCRIAYIPDPKELGATDMADLFAYLEKTQGGDGNGLAFTARNGIIHTIKGVSLPTSLLAEIASKVDGPVLFHTRKSTIGPTCNELCQPFVIDNTAFVHNGHWHGWADVAMELLLCGDMDGHSPINDSLVAATLAIKRGRYSLEAIRTGVFVIMTPNEAWLHLRGGTFRFCKSMGIYASDFPKDWPAFKSIDDDVIAHLLPDGPEFECGGYVKYRTIIRAGGIYYGGQHGATFGPDKDGGSGKAGTTPDEETEEAQPDPEEAIAEWEEDDQEVATGLEGLTDTELCQQMLYPGLREFEYGELDREWQRRQDEKTIEDWRRGYGL